MSSTSVVVTIPACCAVDDLTIGAIYARGVISYSYTGLHRHIEEVLGHCAGAVVAVSITSLPGAPTAYAVLPGHGNRLCSLRGVFRLFHSSRRVEEGLLRVFPCVGTARPSLHPPPAQWLWSGIRAFDTSYVVDVRFAGTLPFLSYDLACGCCNQLRNAACSRGLREPENIAEIDVKVVVSAAVLMEFGS